MKLRVLVLMFSLLVLGLCAEESAVPDTDFATAVASAAEVAVPAGEPAQLKDGYALLNGLITLFENIPAVKVKKTPESEVKPSLGLIEVGNRLSQLSIDAKASQGAGLIDKIFFNRYLRILTIYRLVITPVVRGDLLKELLLRAFDDFVWNITFEHWRWEDKDGIAKMATAMEEEFVQMQIYLDTRQKRDELKKKYGNRMLPPPPPPPPAKKNPENKNPE